MTLRQFTKPSPNEVNRVLRRHNALIVHFSGAPKGSGKMRDNHLYPNDLLHAINNPAQCQLSCSLVVPSDNFSGFARNATGCIGVILGLKSNQSILAAFADDCGSAEDENGSRCVPNQPTLTPACLENTITDRARGSYNEWIVKDYIVLGIFAVAPFEVMSLDLPMHLPEVPDCLKDDKPIEIIKNTNLLAVSDQFNDQHIFGFENQKLCKWVDGKPEPCLHEEIYGA